MEYSNTTKIDNLRYEIDNLRYEMKNEIGELYQEIAELKWQYRKLSFKHDEANMRMHARLFENVRRAKHNVCTGGVWGARKDKSGTFARF
jgi:hypothetical protein